MFRDLEAIQKRALAEGLPYQTLISSVLHKYASGRLKCNWRSRESAAARVSQHVGEDIPFAITGSRHVATRRSRS